MIDIYDGALMNFAIAGVVAVLVLALIWEILRLFFKFKKKLRVRKTLVLVRSSANPIISPDHRKIWELEGTFNPAAYLDSAGKFHLLYRAIGADGVSRIGYAESGDGIHFNRLPYPVFAMVNPRQNISAHMQKFSFALYPSGGSWGGTEDPRMVKIDDRMYVTFNAFDGWDFIRIGVISISEKYFLKKDWRWREPLLISPAGELNKNWVLFPEKINGKFAILHSLSPEVQIDFVDRLEDLAKGIRIIRSRFVQEKRKQWDSRIRGAGPPPVKTPLGWLVFYHAIDDRDPGRYKVGALLLDLGDPKKITARSPGPILAPDEWYENDGKPGIVYACGAVVKDNMLYIYYGAGDKRIGVGTIPLSQLLEWLVKYGKV